MASPSGALGSRLYMTSTAIASTIDTEVEFTAQTWTEIGLIESIGDYGRVFDLVNFQAIADGRTYKLKGGFNDGALSLVMGQDLSDAGQNALATAAAASSQSNYGFRLELNDPPTSVGGPTTYFFRGLPMSFRTTMGAANAIIKAQAGVEVNSDILRTDPAELYDRYNTGGSLSAYTMFKGSDAQATLPVISSNALSCVTGDVGSGFAADGTQAIFGTPILLSAGTTILEARVKISFITNVAFFFGFTDQIAALEMPIYSAASADTITTDASDGVGFMFDTSMATDNIWLVGVNNNVDETSQNTGIAPVLDTYLTLRITLNSSGDATFYINGSAVGSVMTTACRTSVSLYPTFAAMARSTGSRTFTADYLYMRQD